jgi:2-polyprenyl-6-methoxyphenol hydroxylase-like FAD-dependent oxidoreductase
MAKTPIGDHAVVLGASMAGLLTARVLADAYTRVTVIERDELPLDMGHRRGVPQGLHLHGLHAGGRQVLDELFPGFTDQVAQAGAQVGDTLGVLRWQLSGQRLRQVDIGLPGLAASRPFLEGQVRQRVRALPSVRFVEGCDVVGLVTDSGQHRITGVRIVQRHDSCAEQMMAADLIVDATGRGSRTPVWLEQLGYPRPETDRIEIGIGYASRCYRLRPGALGEDKGIFTAAIPSNPRTANLFAQEGERHILTVSGILGDYPPLDPDAFETFAASTCFPDIAEALVGATPLGDPVAFRFPTSVRCRYERLRRFPAGLLVIGDAVCSFNPVYGQGMSAVALEAVTLRDLLRGGSLPTARKYFRRIAKVIDSPWEIAVGADLAFPGVPGKRTAKIRMVNAYVPRFHAGAATDASLAAAFIRVLGMVDRPEGLLRPDRALRVLWAHLRGAAPAPATGPGSRGAEPLAELVLTGVTSARRCRGRRAAR